jgi:hypothetical protein
MPKIVLDIENIKMMRETLCVAQSEIGHSPVHWSRSHINRLQNLIDQLDQHRPLGSDGKHGDRHTETCCCVDTKPEES